MPIQHIDGSATLNGSFPATRVTRHLSLHIGRRIIEIAWQIRMLDVALKSKQSRRFKMLVLIFDFSMPKPTRRNFSAASRLVKHGC
jgi:hypothetical protein